MDKTVLDFRLYLAQLAVWSVEDQNNPLTGKL